MPHWKKQMKYLLSVVYTLKNVGDKPQKCIVLLFVRIEPGLGAVFFFWLLGAGAAWEKKQEPEVAPQPCRKIKRIRKFYFCYSSFGKIISFSCLKNNNFTFFCSYTLLVCGERNILPNLTNPRADAIFFGPLEPELLGKKYQGPEQSCLGKKIRRRSR